MAYCPVCKIKVNNSFTKCPICGHELVKEINITEDEKLFPDKKREKVEHDEEIIIEERKKNALSLRLFWLFTSVIFLIAFSIILIIEFRFIGKTSWTKYPLASIVFAWLLLTSIIYYYKKPFVVGVQTLFEILLFLFVMDLFDKSDNWFFTLGLPATLLFYICTGLFVFISRKSKEKGWNIIAYFFLFISIFSLGLDFLINFYVLKKVILNWSLIVASILVPFALLFLYMHFKLKKRLKYKRFFHI